MRIFRFVRNGLAIYGGIMLGKKIYKKYKNQIADNIKEKLHRVTDNMVDEFFDESPDIYFDPRKVYFENYLKAANARLEMTNIIEHYGFATVMDFKDLADMKSNEDDYHYGWDDISDFKHSRIVSYGKIKPFYYLTIPYPIDISKRKESKDK